MPAIEIIGWMICIRMCDRVGLLYRRINVLFVRKMGFSTR